jgi:hypothetical protein
MALSLMTANRPVEARKGLISQATIGGFCLTQAHGRQSPWAGG